MGTAKTSLTGSMHMLNESLLNGGFVGLFSQWLVLNSKNVSEVYKL